jgi:hypothetical protein
VTLWVEGHSSPNVSNATVEALRDVCRDPNLSINWNSKNRSLRADGQVIYDNPTVLTEDCIRLYKAAQSPIPTVIRSRLPGQVVYHRRDDSFPITTYEPVIARDQPGFTRANYDDAGVTLISIDVVIEPSNDVGRGYWCEDVNENKIPQPTTTIISHEFGHVEEILEGRYDPAATDEQKEAPAIAAENVHRNQRGLPERYGHKGGNDLRKERGGLTGGDCFIATAAYGSELEAEVQELRSFRDDVLLHTRAGAEFFETYFERYYRLSPAIVTLMHTDPEVKEMVRWSLVAPIVQFLRLAKDFPRADTADLPEPWRDYLESARNAFEDWTANLPRPTGFDTIEPVDAAEELRVTLEHFTWRDDDAAGYVAALEAAGALPLAASPGTLRDLALMLRSRGAREETVAAVTGLGLTGNSRREGDPS